MMSYDIKRSVLASALALILAPMSTSYANDSAGYVGTGGVEYIKNDNIAMISEDLYISEKVIKVDYQFKNLSNKDITETILFPLPPVAAAIDSAYTDTKGLIESFKVSVNGKAVTPTVHVRTFMYPVKVVHGYEQIDYDATPIDVTKAFKECGLTQAELMTPWANPEGIYAINKRLSNCNHPALTPLIGAPSDDDYVHWESQVIYSWQQTFKAGKTTHVHHSYAPLVGGTVHMSSSSGEYEEFCVDDALQKALDNGNPHPYGALGYILTTGANWAKPIKHFSLTIERDSDKYVSLCWKNQGKLKKIGANKFQVKTKNFVPKHDLHIAFIKK